MTDAEPIKPDPRSLKQATVTVVSEPPGAMFLDGDREPVKSYGASIRLGLSQYAVLTFDFVNPIDRPNQGWFWQFSIAPGF